ncbi:MAG: hypothetical protein A3H63_00120 [Candidatus Harrisonbacteria bacterium RIFCSPLOWO2_02_FULL_45_10c]|uniref:M23ase beta-sheet core domain-containing protein n=1 Tax=Candidatus Harrisonbacteria bacterium RIFCSPLOWO2_02_FULL_45_10c TaxID=1798410 RepID=A0A1G1ZSV2_9BACT|nr:MAG: hypothetical protein A3H63_00120 [Candidatus Harrisonbacteria bacterium RIFCSPLOWO2_02_FULL_45_10c]
MWNNPYRGKTFFIFIVIISAITPFIVFAANTEDLKTAINEKTKALEEINQKITQTQKELGATEDKGRTLQKEIKGIDYNLNQLGLGIKASEINISKLSLEIESLGYEIGQVRSAIQIKKSGIAQLLRELQHQDNQPLLLTLLKNKSIAESLAELESIASLNAGLGSETNELQALNENLTGKLNLTSDKKNSVEVENQNLKYRKTISENQKMGRQSLLQQTKNQEKTYQQLISELEKQQNSISDEISRAEDELRKTFDPSLLPAKRPGVFAWPVKMVKDGGTGRITQHFGETSYLYRGKPHNGMDIGGVGVGTPVFASDDGIIAAVDNNDKSTWSKYQYGRYVLIEHNNNLTTLYAHLSSAIAKKGASVRKGDLIGYTGSTGYATGPHLHFGVYWSPSIQLKSIPPAAGLVPVGVVIAPEDYL